MHNNVNMLNANELEGDYNGKLLYITKIFLK